MCARRQPIFTPPWRPPPPKPRDGQAAGGAGFHRGYSPGAVTVPLRPRRKASSFRIILLLVSGLTNHGPIRVKAQSEGRLRRRGCCAHNRLVASLSFLAGQRALSGVTLSPLPHL
jgi:hypothetical protein